MITGIALFIGVESQNWTLNDFQIAAQEAKALGISVLIIKIADGTNVWYSQLGGWQKVLDTIKAQGLLAVPYAYCYGDTFGALQGEIVMLKAAMGTVGMVIADIEVEWNGKTDWATSVSNALKDKSGIFAVTTWADPSLQNWQGVLEALKPVVDLWLPQVYSDFLASVYQQQFAGLTVLPVLSLGTDFGPNDVLQHAKDAQSQAIALWEYQIAIGNSAQMVRQIVAMNGVPQGWSDDGTLLRSPDGTPVVLGFRDFVLNTAWDPDDWPLGPEHGASPVEQSDAQSGAGTAQEFRFTRLCWTKARGVYRSRIGQELLWYQDQHKS